MTQKPRFFIYGRKEMGVLIFLGVMVAVFAFTLGVHLGKRVVPRVGLTADHQTLPFPEASEKAPSRQELTDQAPAATEEAEASLGKALQDEVSRSGVKLDHPRQLELPNQRKGEAKSEQPKAVESETASKENTEAKVPEEDEAKAQESAGVGRYSLQIGSYPKREEARYRIEALENLGLKPFLRAADLQGKGTWFRVFVGGYPTKEAAERAGNEFRRRHVIETFIVARNSG